MKYHPDNQEEIDKIHQVLIDTMRNGNGVAEVCDKLDIAESTFYCWVNEYPKFSEAYQLARTYCKAWWQRELHDNLNSKHWNERAWRLQVFNRFSESHCEGRRITLKKLREAKGYNDIGEAIKNAMADGEVTPDEAYKISQVIMNDANLKERTVWEDRLVELEKHQAKK